MRMKMRSQKQNYHLKLFSIPCFFLLLSIHHSFTVVSALNIGVQSINGGMSENKQQCSRKCESEHCTVPPFLRYGKYCGILYSGCPGEKPCDGLDACCQTHDACVQAKHNDYLSQECNENLLDCIEKYKKSGAASFKGNKCMVQEVVDVITIVIEAALLAGRVLHKP
ncbi:phospholipase A2-alpha-like [Dioscorea cayenensis subsp. rotundata]|uniref:phospholipase A2 n=1 Tax=Dioscorea cayennensis subsp. rotundata TaxID=55577 RepID=A0AB40BHL6_DIOCR|nr:phospholipase A2-alpha-like [Dioscorea cayenensis subsp. rotundata]